MSLIVRFVLPNFSALKVIFHQLVDVIHDGLMPIALIGLECQHVVCLGVDSLRGDTLLSAHRIDGDDGPLAHTLTECKAPRFRLRSRLRRAVFPSTARTGRSIAVSSAAFSRSDFSQASKHTRVVRVKWNADCEASSGRLLDIGCQLEDAIDDGRRFIIGNCIGDECQRIFEALQQRQQRIWSET